MDKNEKIELIASRIEAEYECQKRSVEYILVGQDGMRSPDFIIENATNLADHLGRQKALKEIAEELRALVSLDLQSLVNHFASRLATSTRSMYYSDHNANQVAISKVKVHAEVMVIILDALRGETAGK